MSCLAEITVDFPGKAVSLMAAFVSLKSQYTPLRLDGPFCLLHRQLDVRFSSKQSETWTHLTTAHISAVCLLPSEMSSGPENSWGTALSDFSKVLPSAGGYIYHSSMMVSHAMPPEDLKVMHTQQRFLALPYTTEIFLDSLKLYTILCVL